MIHKPLLPPKTGYVESIDSQGNPVYVAMPEQLEKLRRQAQNANPQADTDAMLVDLEYRMTLLELGVTE